MHGVGNGEKICLVGRVVFVFHPVLHGSRSHRRQKGLFDLDTLERSLEIVDVCFDGGMADVLKGLVAVEDPRVVSDGSPSSLVKVIGKFHQVSAEYGSRSEIRAGRLLDKATEPLARIAREIGFAQFAVVDDINPAINLLAHAFGHGAAHPLAIGFVVIGFPLVLCIEHLFEIRWLRQGARMRDQNSLSAAFHPLPPRERYWSDGVVEYWIFGYHHSATPLLQYSMSVIFPCPRLPTLF